MADELLSVLTRFHRDVVAPDIERMVSRLGRVEHRLDDVVSHFDAIYKRFDRLESEYQALRPPSSGSKKGLPPSNRSSIGWRCDRSCSS